MQSPFLLPEREKETNSLANAVELVLNFSEKFAHQYSVKNSIKDEVKRHVAFPADLCATYALYSPKKVINLSFSYDIFKKYCIVFIQEFMYLKLAGFCKEC